MSRKILLKTILKFYRLRLNEREENDKAFIDYIYSILFKEYGTEKSARNRLSSLLSATVK